MNSESLGYFSPKISFSLRIIIHLDVNGKEAAWNFEASATLASVFHIGRSAEGNVNLSFSRFALLYGYEFRLISAQANSKPCAKQLDVKVRQQEAFFAKRATRTFVKRGSSRALRHLLECFAVPLKLILI